MESYCIGCVPMYASHTADDLNETLDDVLLQWNMNPAKMSAITTDNASNNQKAFASRFVWLPCFGHNLDLAVRKSLALEQVSSALVKLRKLVSAFNRSTKRKRELQVKQTDKHLPLHQPIHDEPTRWGSTYDMIHRFIEQQAALCAVIADDRKSLYLMLSYSDITTLETVHGVLEPLSNFTDALSGEKQVNISCVQPVLWKIFNELAITSSDSSLTCHMKEVIADDLRKRYVSGEIPILLDCATFFDIRFKDTFVMDSDAKSRLLHDDENGSEHVIGNSGVNSDSNVGAVNVETTEPPLKRLKASLSDLLTNIKSEKKREDRIRVDMDDNGQSSAMSLQNELSLYEQLEEIDDINKDPLSWWSSNNSCFPKLAKHAKRYLCISATSVASERVFSTSGNIVSARPNSLTPEHVDMLTFLAKNL